MDIQKVREVADRHREMIAHEARDTKPRRIATSLREVVQKPWNALADTLREYGEIYNDQFGHPRLSVEVWPDVMALQATNEMLVLELNRHSGQVRGSLSERYLDHLGMRIAVRDGQPVWVFHDVYPVEPADIALVLGTQVTDLAAGVEPWVSDTSPATPRFS